MTVGDTVGRYRVLEKLGAGGMGEVYRARDTKLDREVALKILPDSFASDPDRVMRFEREARTPASLNHPHIAQIHGVEDRAIVMELVEGEDLARRIADALDAAHSAGIIQRDLKPANIKVRADEAVKVLDFGSAKAGDADRDGAFDSPTCTSPAMTQAGVILGTAAYMSPEQARGKPVDKRSDIWAFGCVVFEMLSGTPGFDGETVTDVLGAIVRGEPNWNALPGDTPREVQRLLSRCLQKDAAKRLRDSGDVRAEIEEFLTASATVRSQTPVTSTRRGAGARLAIAWLATAAIVAAAAAGTTSLLGPAADVRAQKLSIAVGGNGLVREPAISPDGTKIVFVAPAKARLSVRLYSAELTLGNGSVRGGTPKRVFSPDIRFTTVIDNRRQWAAAPDGRHFAQPDAHTMSEDRSPEQPFPNRTGLFVLPK
jgi:hypothetical protein